MSRRQQQPTDASMHVTRHPRRAAVRTVVSTLFASLVTSLVVGVLVAPAASAAPATPAVTADYVVKDGDSLYNIARKLGAPMADLLTANNLTADSVVHPGDHLVVPATATKPPAGAVAAAATTSATYTVKSGDYLFGIARTLGTPIADLLAINKLTINSVVLPGTKLAVPPSATNPNASTAAVSTPSTPAAGTPSSYTVKAGDYLFGIARMYGISLGTLLKLNDLTATSVVLPGRSLLIPAGAVATSATPVNPGPPTTASKIDTVLAYARAQLGKPYRFNTAGPDTFDCSGLTAAAYAQISLWLPHQSAMQSTRGVAIDWRTDDIEAGDLVFMFTNDHPTVISHVGIAINSWQWIHAPRPGDVVRIGLIPSDNVIQAVRRYVTD